MQMIEKEMQMIMLLCVRSKLQEERRIEGHNYSCGSATKGDNYSLNLLKRRTKI
jgi:hypothetical protein